MSKRDYISEILEIRQRLGDTSNIWNHFNRRYAVVLDAANFLKETKPSTPVSELTKYVPIAAVACLEQYFRTWAARLIDSGKPFINRIKRFSTVTFNHESIIALNEKTISLGEFLSHQMSFSSLDDVNRNFSRLLYEQEAGTSFLEELKKTPVKLGRLTWKCDASAITAVKELYRLRHIFCHEVALKEEITLESAIEIYLGGLRVSVVFDKICSRALKRASIEKV